ncbi:hypothetical protein HPB51_014749 [Rhipicephalus microplus]|uniref:Uncharacterized protein n=1 Tax=Rhipicephalus microplus TaxID=6941 RepID=A0A9J6DN90_RHIMP|nr:hypothetical protein HPB51_014749 [Rhipicephalus microplus]
MAGRSSSRSGNKQPTTHWLNVSWDDIVERLALVFYTDESFETVDYINVMLLGWALFALFVYVVGTLLANRFGRQRHGVAASAKRVDGQEPVEETVSAGSAHEQHAAAAGRWANAKEPVPFAVSASGSDPDAVLWTNRVLSWVLAQKEHEFLSKPWIQALNEKLAKSPPKVPEFARHSCGEVEITGLLGDVVQIEKSRTLETPFPVDLERERRTLPRASLPSRNVRRQPLISISPQGFQHRQPYKKGRA